MAGRPETKQYWMDQLSEYWDAIFLALFRAQNSHSIQILTYGEIL